MNPRITIQPVFSYKNLLKSLFVKTKKDNKIFYQSGSASLYFSLKEIIEKRNINKVFLPNFICEEVYDYIKYLKLNIIFYKIDSELNIQFDSFDKKNLSDKSVVLIVNYFGFPSNWKLINSLKKQYNCLIIEDNCHTLYSKDNEKHLGSNGDISFNSLRKVLPVLSGSYLISNNPSIHFTNHNVIKSPKISEIIYSLRGLRRKTKSTGLSNKTLCQNISNQYIDYFSYKIFMSNIFNEKKIRKRRIQNYQFWINFLKHKELNTFSSLDISDNISPYAFPCKTDNNISAKKWIEWGKKRNINIVKWPAFPKEININNIDSNLRNVLLFPVNHQYKLSEEIVK